MWRFAPKIANLPRAGGANLAADVTSEVAMKAFTEHPQSVGETYFEHMGSAFGFGIRMLGGGIACLMHGIFPFLFTKTGSSTIALLHDRMIANRVKHSAPHGLAQGQNAS
jgi:hypothetical protein